MLGLAFTMQAQVRLNQVGLSPQQEKVATVEGVVKASQVKILDAKTGLQVVKPHVLRVVTSPFSKKKRTVIDFSSLKTEGDYLVIAGKHLQPFCIRQQALHEVSRGALKAFYLVRSGMPIEAQYAGEWARPVGHADTQVKVHSSAASPGRPEGTMLSSPGGWYDAGEYAKYTTNAAITVHTLLTSYITEHKQYDTISFNIPESNNSTPDILDEVMYELKWMLTMQDPNDGGVYNKVTPLRFSAFIKPADDKADRYMIGKTIDCAYDFAATMALASRVYAGNKDYPDFSEKAKKAALDAYRFASKHSEYNEILPFHNTIVN